MSRVLLTVIGGLLYGLGWVTYKVLAALAWCGTAVKVGWREAHSGNQKRSERPTRPV